jgi:hypothetical protein
MQTSLVYEMLRCCHMSISSPIFDLDEFGRISCSMTPTCLGLKGFIFVVVRAVGITSNILLLDQFTLDNGFC